MKNSNNERIRFLYLDIGSRRMIQHNIITSISQLGYFERCAITVSKSSLGLTSKCSVSCSNHAVWPGQAACKRPHQPESPLHPRQNTQDGLHLSVPVPNNESTFWSGCPQSGSAKTNKVFPALGRCVGFRCCNPNVFNEYPVLTATY